ncbi:hypothetical protein ACH5RR_022954 [Cinchona calisaya]|uniref:Retrotransposon gag domain-containing protein n=1 Tax=Cinchona calisaya TaxID=153742 RepID=A0ABD2ZCF9_9GENT
MGSINNGKQVDAYCKSTPVLSRADSEIEIVGEFRKLKQTDIVGEYQERFAELRDLMMTKNYGLTNDYLISGFLSGLQEDIRSLSQKPRPKSLIHAFNLARIQEIAR